MKQQISLELNLIFRTSSAVPSVTHYLHPHPQLTAVVKSPAIIYILISLGDCLKTISDKANRVLDVDIIKMITLQPVRFQYLPILTCDISMQATTYKYN